MYNKIEELKLHRNNLKEIQVIINLLIKEHKFIDIYFFKSDSIFVFNNIKEIKMLLGNREDVKEYYGEYIEIQMFNDDNNSDAYMILKANLFFDVIIKLEENRISFYWYLYILCHKTECNLNLNKCRRNSMIWFYWK